MDFSNFNNAEKAQMNKIIEKKQVCCIYLFCNFSNLKRVRQMQDFFRIYATVVERCFNTCCNDFTSKALSSKEVSHALCPLPPILTWFQETCVLNCYEKFFKHSERVGVRFAEHNAGSSVLSSLISRSSLYLFTEIANQALQNS